MQSRLRSMSGSFHNKIQEPSREKDEDRRQGELAGLPVNKHRVQSRENRDRDHNKEAEEFGMELHAKHTFDIIAVTGTGSMGKAGMARGNEFLGEKGNNAGIPNYRDPGLGKSRNFIYRN